MQVFNNNKKNQCKLDKLIENIKTDLHSFKFITTLNST